MNRAHSAVESRIIILTTGWHSNGLSLDVLRDDAQRLQVEIAAHVAC
jgi:hypothetical protein